MNLEFRKEQKEKKGTPRKEHFISSFLFHPLHTSQIVVALWAIKPQFLVALG